MLVQKHIKELKPDLPLRQGEGTRVRYQLEHVAGVRTRAIEKKLKGVELLNNEEVQTILPELLNGEVMNEEE